MLKKQKLMENLVSDNMDQVNKLDDFVCDVLKYKLKQKYLDMDVTFAKLQLKHVCVMSPLPELGMLV